MPQSTSSFTDALKTTAPEGFSQPAPKPTPLSSPQPLAAPNPTANSSASHNCDSHCNGKCEGCVKGGMPFKKETLSLIVVVLIGVSTVLFALWVTTMRERDALKVAGPSAPAAEPGDPAAAAAMNYELPAEKTVLKTVPLPSPTLTGRTSVEQALSSRRSRRTYAETPLTMQAVSQILWSAQGVTDDAGHRTAPSARSAYPYTVYMVVRSVTGLDAGVYRYNPSTHAVEYLGVPEAGEALIAAGVQDNSQKAPAVLAVAASYAKMAKVSPADPVTGTLIEAGHIGQNVYLQVEALGMSTVVTAGFDAAKVGQALQLDTNEDVVYLIPFGNRGAEEEAAH